MARTIAKDHDQKRAQILKSAAKVFAEEGFDRASMTKLAAECGISKANIYHYYDSKDAILFDILDSYLSRLRDRIFGVDTEGLDPDDRLRRVIREILRAYQGADHEHQVQISALSALPEDQQDQMRAYQRDMIKLMGRCLHDIAPEVFETHPDKLRGVTMSVYGMLNWYFMWNSDAGAQERDDYADLVCNLTLKGVQGI
ncbi:TetR/AcrR family transcriptional regulator [Antarcticimicrobium sediminis]|uniref:TetR/AcrR family transcriptional regulator n=1 Tax=Antarcticimicrobium sediminis TaxID=2546227 RepID=A0A4R5EXM8_9RHOB|nr:TetR/AcrR family transcriptional regulator [Antarcticimicrobium sediminis]TDE39829.1 TetR/AcrR family transcriptional regulator [Antarcticimicrobium sediminis]